jgi:hypothetical protein
MSRIDRRAFVMGCLAVPLAGCADQVNSSFGAGSGVLLKAKFLNCGQWSSDEPPMFIVTGGINQPFCINQP